MCCILDKCSCLAILYSAWVSLYIHTYHHKIYHLKYENDFGFDLFPLTNETNLIAASKDVQSVSMTAKRNGNHLVTVKLLQLSVKLRHPALQRCYGVTWVKIIFLMSILGEKFKTIYAEMDLFYFIFWLMFKD